MFFYKVVKHTVMAVHFFDSALPPMVFYKNNFDFFLPGPGVFLKFTGRKDEIIGSIVIILFLLLQSGWSA